MEHIYHIRYDHSVKGKSIRQIAKETGHDRATIKKYVEMDDFSPPEPIKRQRKSKTDAYREQVKQWLK